MKVLFLSRLFYPHTGGIEKHIYETSRILIKKGYKVTVLTTKYDNGLQDKETTKEGIEIVRFKQPEVKFVGILYTWYWLLKNINLIKESGIVHIHDVFIWYWPIKILIPGRKVFTTFHGQWGRYPVGKTDLLQKRIGAKFSDGVISIGKYIDKYYGISSDIISYGATSLPSGRRLKDNTITYVGRLDKITGLPVFLGFLRKEKLKNLKVIFCGDGELRYECEKYGQVLGWTDPNPFYKKSKFVFVSGYLTIMEAFANKCLVFCAYKNKLHKDYYTLTPFKDLLMAVPNAKKLSQKINYYLKHEKEVKNSCDKGYEWVKKQTWGKMAEEYKTLWNTK